MPGECQKVTVCERLHPFHEMLLEISNSTFKKKIIYFLIEG